jgi:hypothetical protein
VNLAPLRRHFAPLLLLALSGVIAGIIATWNGVSYSMDTAYYVVYAERIRTGHGLTVPVTSNLDARTESWLVNWPPLYPMALALAGDVPQWTRILAIGTLASVTALTYVVAYAAIRSQRAAALAAILFLTIPSVNNAVFAVGHSEALYAALSLLAVALMIHYRFGVESNSMRPALLAAALTALASLTRYLGVVLAIAMFIYSILWARSVQSRRRWQMPILFLLSCVPLGLYVLYVSSVTGNVVDVGHASVATLQWGHVVESLRQIGLELLHGWSFVTRSLGLLSNWWLLVLAVPLVWLVIRLVQDRSKLRGAWNSIHLLLILYLTLYMVSFWVLAARAGNVPAEFRHYVPIYPVLVILVIQLVYVAKPSTIAIGIVVGLYCLSGLQALFNTSQGLLYNDPRWRTDPIVASIPRLIPQNALVHGQDVSYLAMRLGGNVPVRMFGGDDAFQNYSCSSVRYPAGYSVVAFTLFNSSMLQTQPQGQIEQYFRNWAASCGTVESIVSDDFAMLMIVRLHGRDAH